MNSSTGPIFDPLPKKNTGVYLLTLLAFAIVGIAFFQKSTGTGVQSPSPSVTTNEDVSVVVEYGDSYTTIARKALNTPGAIGLYAETILSQKLKTQPLKVGSNFKISKKLIEETLSSFSSLSRQKKESWERLYHRTRSHR